MTPGFRFGAYDVQFYASDRHEPPHVHVRRDNGQAKFWLEPLTRARDRGFSERDLTAIGAVLKEHREELLESWHEFFS